MSLKTIKRQMYGGAGLDLLKRRFLLAKSPNVRCVPASLRRTPASVSAEVPLQRRSVVHRFRYSHVSTRQWT